MKWVRFDVFQTKKPPGRESCFGWSANACNEKYHEMRPPVSSQERDEAKYPQDARCFGVEFSEIPEALAVGVLDLFSAVCDAEEMYG